LYWSERYDIIGLYWSGRYDMIGLYWSERYDIIGLYMAVRFILDIDILYHRCLLVIFMFIYMYVNKYFSVLFYQLNALY